jgi:hypothetical protein
MGSPRSSLSRIVHSRRWRDAVLLAAAILVTAATVNALAGQVTRLHRQALDRRLFQARVAAAGQAHEFDLPRVFAGVRVDRACAPRREGPPPAHRLCFVMRTHGPLFRRIVGGYRLPLRGADVRRHRYGCFGVPARTGRCGGAPPHAKPPGAA